jgi:hypothetical protein
MQLPRPVAAPRTPLDRRTLVEEIVVVLSLSLLEPAAGAIVDFFRSPARSRTRRTRARCSSIS